MSAKNGKTMLPEDRVHLKPLFGMQAGTYLAILYGAILLVILFLLLVFPGIRRPGTIGTFHSQPWGAAVRVDDVYMGTTPCEIFLPKGKRTIDFVMPGFDMVRQEYQAGGRLFASLFFPRRDRIRAEMRTEDPAEVLVQGAADYAAWSFAGETTAIYQVPLSLSEAVYRTGAAGAVGAEFYPQLHEILEGAARYAVSRTALKDLIRAKLLLDNGGNPPSPVSLVRSASDILAYASRNPGVSAWLAEVLPQEAASALVSSSWYVNRNAAAGKRDNENIPAAGGRMVFNGMSFIEIPRGSFIQGASFPHELEIERFWIMETELSADGWQAFLAELPEWRQDNIAELLSKNLITEDYMGVSDNPAYPASAAGGVSWFAAKAYCQWLNSFLPPSLAASYELRLPTEAEWEYAAKAGREAGPSSLKAMSGGLWEWCEDPYAPLNFLPVSIEAAERLGSPERPVRGGSWVNIPGSVSIETRASLPPSSCSPFVSFRPVIALKRAGHE